MVWEEPVVPSASLRTRILELTLSTFNTFIFSSPVIKMSFSLILKGDRSPVTLKKVTIPVTDVSPIATPVVPTPANASLFDWIPTA